MEIFSSFISENASFFNSFGNWVLIPGIIVVFILDHRLSKLNMTALAKWPLKLFFILSIFVLSSLVYMINFPLKPMVESITTVQENIGSQVHDFTFQEVRNDDTYSISDFHGNVILLNFWGTYCRPCIEEFPDLRKIESNYRDDVKVIALSDEDKDRIQSFIQRIESPSIVGSFSSEKWINLENFRPLTIVIDKDGTVREYTFGKKDYAYFEMIVKKYM